MQGGRFQLQHISRQVDCTPDACLQLRAEPTGRSRPADAAAITVVTTEGLIGAPPLVRQRATESRKLHGTIFVEVQYILFHDAADVAEVPSSVLEGFDPELGKDEILPGHFGLRRRKNNALDPREPHCCQAHLARLKCRDQCAAGQVLAPKLLCRL